MQPARRLSTLFMGLLLAVAVASQASPTRAEEQSLRLSAEEQAAELHEATELMRRFARETSEEQLLKMTRELIAPREICAKVFEPEVAARLATEYLKWWEQGDFILGGKPGQTEVHLAAATTDELMNWTGNASKNLAGGWKRIAKYVHPGYTLYSISFVEPGKELGMRFDGLTKVEGKWYIFPKAWRMVPDETATTSEAPTETPPIEQPADEQVVDAYIKSAEVFAQQGKHAEVIALLDEAETNGIKRQEIYTLKGQSHQAMGKPSAAFTAFTQALAINPNYAPALVGRARIWLQAAQFDNAIADATRSIDAGVPAYEIRADAQLGRAELLMAKGADERGAMNDMGGALRDYSSLIEDRSRSRQSALYAHDKRGQILMNLSAYDLAIAEYDRSIAIEDHAWAHANRAHALARLKRYGEAAAEFGKVLESEPNAAMLLERAELNARQAKEQDALADVTKAVELALEDPQVKAAAEALRKRIPDIVKQAKNASDSDDTPITKEMADIAERADAAFMAKQYVDAMTGYNRLIELDHPDAYRKRGILLAKAEARPQALGDFSKSIARHGDKEPDIIWARAEQLLHLGAYDLALREYERSFKLGVKHVGSHYGAGVLHDKAGQHREAVADFTFEIEAGSENPYNWLGRGLAYERLAEYDLAMVDYQAAASKTEKGSDTFAVASSSFALAAKRKNVQDTLTQVEQHDAAGLIEQMDPLVRPYVDQAALKQRLQLITQRFGKPLRASLLDLELTDLRVAGSLKFESGDVDGEFVYDGAGHLVGLSLNSDGLGFDTFDTLHDTDQLAEVARQFWEFVYTGKGEKAYKLLVPPAAATAYPLQPFLDMVHPIAAKVSGVGVKNIPLQVVRIHKPNKPNERPSLDIYHLIELGDLKYNTARMNFAVIEEAGDEFTPRAFHFDTGDFHNEFPSHDLSVQEACFRAIGTGDVKQVLNLIHPHHRSNVNPAVLKVVLTLLDEQLGSFKSISPAGFQVVTTYDHASQTTLGRGSVEFEKGTVPAVCSHQYGWMDSFNIQADFSNWTKRIEDTAALEKQGELLLRELINGDPAKAHAMLQPAFQEQISVEQLVEMKHAYSKNLGKAKSITIESKEYIEDTWEWKFHYKIVADKVETDGDVTFDFDAFSGHIGGFQILIPATAESNSQR